MKLTLPQIRRFASFLSVIILVFALGVWSGKNNLKVTLEPNQTPKLAIDRQTPQKYQNVDFSLFWEIWDRLEKNYFDKTKIDQSKMVYGAIKGMVDALGDPYTAFLPPEEQKRTTEDLDGEFEGVGIQIGFKGSQLAVIAPLDGAPAQIAGVKAGDFIVGIKDKNKNIEKSTYGLSLPEAVEMIRGKAQTKVILVVTRKDEEKPLEIEITRGKIEVPSVELKVVGKDNNIAHLKLNRFGAQTPKEWEKAVAKILSSKPKGVILDMRNNPGGLLTGSVEIASEFLKTGVVLIQENGRGEKEESKVSGKAKLADVSLVVLVNGGSASASEIVAGALKDLERAKIVGEKTFGKGTIQEAQEIKNSGLHITIAKWLTPNGTWINEEGIKPDVEIKDNEETQDIDEQLEEAIKLLQ